MAIMLAPFCTIALAPAMLTRRSLAANDSLGAASDVRCQNVAFTPAAETTACAPTISPAVSGKPRDTQPPAKDETKTRSRVSLSSTTYLQCNRRPSLKSTLQVYLTPSTSNSDAACAQTAVLPTSSPVAVVVPATAPPAAIEVPEADAFAAGAVVVAPALAPEVVAEAALPVDVVASLPPEVVASAAPLLEVVTSLPLEVVAAAAPPVDVVGSPPPVVPAASVPVLVVAVVDDTVGAVVSAAVPLAALVESAKPGWEMSVVLAATAFVVQTHSGSPSSKPLLWPSPSESAWQRACVQLKPASLKAVPKGL
mmetsp:Transcript_1377/g.3669  ORF Transcript_1377/g.3669 Transcript_1377/m.3669 type:complete len:310 (-) Transcript_1377:213-1142(-)